MFYKQRKQIVSGSLICAGYVSTRLSSLNNLFLTINPFMPNKISQSYQFDKSISVLRVAGGSFRLHSYFL